MAQVKTIYFQDDIAEKLKTVNASALINELVRNHFKCSGSKDHLEKQIEDLQNRKKHIIETYEKQKEQIEKELSIQEKEEFIKKQEEEKAKMLAEKEEENKPMPKFDVKAYNRNNQSKVRESANRAFRHYMGREMNNEEYINYFQNYLDQGRPMTEFIEVAIKNMPMGSEDNLNKDESKEQGGSSQTEKPYE